MNIIYAPFTPSPSPPSSPALGPVDSSPPSSPSLEPLAFLDDQPSSTLAHPFAASTKATKSPPQYEKRWPGNDVEGSKPGGKRKASDRDLDFVERYSARKHRAFTHDYEQDDSSIFGDETVGGSADTSFVHSDPQQEIWDETISKTIDTGFGLINLGGRGLTYISPGIKDLQNFFVPAQTPDLGGRLFSRTTTAPVGRTSSAFERTPSGVGIAREELHIYLASNQIRSLPRELCVLQRLTILSLRNNKLTHLPPAIAHLQNLRDLNIAMNSIQYLPAEMLGMPRLVTLVVANNPLLPLPGHVEPTRFFARSGSRSGSGSGSTSTSRSTSCTQRSAVSPTTRKHAGRVPPLTELALRALVSPSSVSLASPASSNSAHSHTRPYNPQDTVLATAYTLPLPFPPSGPLEALARCVPGAFAASAFTSTVARPEAFTSTPAEEESDADTDEESLTPGTCPSPSHFSPSPSRFVHHASPSRFVHPAEERFTWENRIGGADVLDVPVKWRGCAGGCLDFLDEGQEGTKEVVDTEAGDGAGDGDDAEVVRVVSLAPGALDFDD
ncbi:hypothetical protein PLICRDRAFT_300967 [Plicaturopsis crispa FD-325 SS-3]|nr:hypothetical protein PLICRDRAFT_300967 [Plicaturopsis crispa FD-325 SS-3]